MDIVSIGGELATILLIIILSVKEIYSTSSYWNKRASTILRLLTISLLFVFIIIVIFKILEVLHS
jgi:hypothetical protein